ncbi:hypothetical protein F5141DRAFT_1069606 [Pisolithus sp. B1]|nr:hypothetical protein F5141DRAFT_1069606 [Pisolithus sp. B1]
MSAAPLSFLNFPSGGQNSPMFTFRTLQDLYNTAGSNFFNCNNSQTSTLPTTSAALAWGSNSQISQETYQIQSNNSLAFSQGISELLIQYLQDTVMKLQSEITSLKAECSAIQNAYNTLVSHLTINNSNSSTSPAGRPINVTL